MSYNKSGTGARVGNWVEEEALKNVTGTHRITTVGDRAMDTSSRVIAHSQRVEPKDYKSATHAAQESIKRAGEYEGRRMGARERLLEQQLAAEAKEFTTRREPEVPAMFQSEASEAFSRPSDDLYRTADRTHRITNPDAAAASRLDVTGVDALRRTAGGMSAASLAASFPISYHTQLAAKGGYGMTAASVSSNPFLRDSKFTNPISEGEKLHAGAEDVFGVVTATGSSLAPHAGSELTMLEILDKLRAAIAARGGENGFRTLTRILKRMDTSGDGCLSPEEFSDGLRDMGIHAPAREVLALVAYFDTDRSGKISVDEFQKGIAPPLNAGRLSLINEAFTRLDKTGDGTVTIDDLAAAYDTSKHPKVISGEMSRDDVLRGFLDGFEASAEKDGIVTQEEFTEYYRGISAGIPRDDYFELMMRNAWHISGGSGWSENTTCKRVCVKFADGEERVIEIKDDLGMRPDDIPAIKARLRKQGITNFVDVKLFG